ncbi:MAG TPA: phage baseplate assembly protein V [Phnomibacter sp.]|nr:phage baseplate assembly protein V [Phnomibacter sp.]
MEPKEIQSPAEWLEWQVMLEGAAVKDIGEVTVLENAGDEGEFSLEVFMPGDKNTLADHEAFYNKWMGAAVTIKIGKTLEYEGIVLQIECMNQDILTTEYIVRGKGKPCKMNAHVKSAVFLKQKIGDIFKKVIEESGLQAEIAEPFNNPFEYTVQYNQTNLEFIKMLAARYGVWMIYDGKKWVINKVGTKTLTLIEDHTLFNIEFKGTIPQAEAKGYGFDLLNKKAITGQTQPEQYEGLSSVVVKKSKQAYGAAKAAQFMPMAFSQDGLQIATDAANRANHASIFNFSGTTYTPEVRLGTLLQIKAGQGSNHGTYLVTSVRHTISNKNYSNYFTACHKGQMAPPYTNIELYPYCTPQPAIVTSNYDKDGKDLQCGVKVKFAWMEAGIETPIIPIVSPYAGPNRGFRWLPEVDDEVLVGFMNNHAERPYVIGSLYHSNATPGEKNDEKNDVKIIGSRTGRRLEIREKDSEGILSLSDNYKDKYPANTVKHTKKGSGNGQDMTLDLRSAKDSSSYTAVTLVNKDELKIELKSGSTALEITCDGKNNKIIIKSSGDIELDAVKDIKLSAKGNIALAATQKVTVDGKTGVDVTSSANIKIDATAQLNASGMVATFEGKTKADFKGGAMASLTGALVKIN